jgi:ADP-ribose pyrophosphatase YjhB (NUDIX family)
VAYGSFPAVGAWAGVPICAKSRILCRGTAASSRIELAGSSFARDPRGHSVSVVYVAAAKGDPRAQDDAKAVHVVAPEELPSTLAFDHARILADYVATR